MHFVRIALDGLVYVRDRLSNLVQAFREDGSYVKEFSVAPRTAGNGSVWNIVLSRDPQRKWLVCAEAITKGALMARLRGAIDDRVQSEAARLMNGGTRRSFSNFLGGFPRPMQTRQQQPRPCIGEPRFERLGRPAALLDEQRIELRRVHRPNDVRRLV